MFWLNRQYTSPVMFYWTYSIYRSHFIGQTINIYVQAVHTICVKFDRMYIPFELGFLYSISSVIFWTFYTCCVLLVKQYILYVCYWTDCTNQLFFFFTYIPAMFHWTYYTYWVLLVDMTYRLWVGVSPSRDVHIHIVHHTLQNGHGVTVHKHLQPN